MKIAIIGAGAMGSIYGGHLSLHNDVYLVDKNPSVVEKINTEGLVLQECGEDVTYYPKAVISTAEVGPVDLVILFVKSLFSKVALEGNQALIGDHTYVMTLQNGSGHEEILKEFVPIERIIIGTTEDNGTVLAPAYVRRGGNGRTNIGLLVDDTSNILPLLKENFDGCGFDMVVHQNIQQLIWNKLFCNVSLSAVTGILQVPMGYIAANEHAWFLTSRLIKEAVQVAHALGLEADEEEILEKVKAVSESSPEGITSICSDLSKGRLTEVETISGSVVRAAKKCGIEVPSHEFVVHMVHAMEEKAN